MPIKKIKLFLTRSKYLIHETKKKALFKFLIIFFIVITYFVFESFHFGIQNGFFITLLTWSFFVLCTPIADGGFLIDFPVRLFTNFRMVYSEIIVWVSAISINIYAFFFRSFSYDETVLLQLFHHILSQPIPFWVIIVLSCIGTFISIKFGDELIDVVTHKQRLLYKKHKNKYKIILLIFIFLLILVLYDFLLKRLGVHMPF